jgi:hypothetical protein
MKHLISIVLFLIVTTVTSSQTKEIPTWFLDDLSTNIGTWITSNSKYTSEAEAFTHYAIEWSWGVGKTSIVGKLYGLTGGVESDTFWEFRQFWDNENERAALHQYGHNGVNGIGAIRPFEDDKMESVQVFSLPDGRTWLERHITSFSGSNMTTTSFQKDDAGVWKEKRTYVWKKESSQ